MGQLDSELSKLPGLVTDYFVIESTVASTRTAEAFKALDKFKRQSVGLWVSRYPLALGNDAASQFAGRISKLGRLGVVTDILSFGIDASGYAFVVFPVFDGQPILTGDPEGAELERRYLSTLRLVDRIHAIGLSCGDLCLDSFVLDRSGNVKWIAVLGSFDGISTATASLPPTETLSYLSPEQRSGKEPTAESDVFALGVLGYRMFTGIFPDSSGGESALPPRVTSLKPGAPGWADDVFFKAMSWKPSDRYATASAMINALVEWRTDAAYKASTPAVIENQTPSNSSRRGEIEAVQISIGRQMGSEIPKPPPPEPPKSPLRLGLVGYVSLVGLAALTIGVAYILTTRKTADTTVRERLDAAPGDVQGGADSAERHAKDRTRYISALVTSDDPLAHDALIRELRDAEDPAVREAAWRGLLDRARRLGAQRSSDQLRSWIKGQGPDFRPTDVENLLRVTDPGFPDDKRLETLRAEYQKFPKLVMRITAALALDLNQTEKFRDILAVMVSDSTNMQAETHSTLSMMLLVPELSALFMDDIVANAGAIPDEDVTWLLKELSKKNSQHIDSVADIAISRKLYPGVPQVFLEIIRKKSELPPPVLGALVRGATGEMAVEDVSVFGSWYDPESERALFAVVLCASDPKVLETAFNTLVGKAFANGFLASLMEFARSIPPEGRTPIVRLMATIALHDQVSEMDFSGAFAELDKLPKSKELILLLLKSESPRVIEEVITRYAKLLNTSSLLDLLVHNDKQVRIAAIQNLRNANDIAALKLMLDGYDKESDPEVRKAYEENITVVRERRSRTR